MAHNIGQVLPFITAQADAGNLQLIIGYIFNSGILTVPAIQAKNHVKLAIHLSPPPPI